MPESLRLWIFGKRMEWNHLPVAGGIYDQHPRLLAEWDVIWDAEYRHEKAKERREQASRPQAKKGR